ncbi:SIMPL domain-containing protein [Cesiribacter sp. SM1]|uniref:SIMPL domain-containing protein n=1 Tax=Cesiribacter sp. SM1 TaxID=2861196 RepID=UPI001CD4A58E|nr:SIMPL domain-containing protein [Cesiribacter sp. SM1]
MSTKTLKIRSLLSLLTIAGISFFASAQTTSQSPQPINTTSGIIEVQGQGRMRVQPDQTIVMIQVQNTNTEAGRSVQIVTEQVEQLLKKLQEAGFRKDEIKTSQFFLNENNEWRDGRMFRNGYTASQTMEVRFPLDQQRMTKLTNVFANTQEGVTFQFSFGLSDKLQQQVKDELIRKAIQDAREKASVIARSANIRLGSIRKIDYGQQGIRPYEATVGYSGVAEMRKQAADFPQTEIQTIEMTDQILVIWTLEP